MWIAVDISNKLMILMTQRIKKMLHAFTEMLTFPCFTNYTFFNRSKSFRFI